MLRGDRLQCVFTAAVQTSSLFTTICAKPDRSTILQSDTSLNLLTVFAIFLNDTQNVISSRYTSSYCLTIFKFSNTSRLTAQGERWSIQPESSHRFLPGHYNYRSLGPQRCDQQLVKSLTWQCQLHHQK